MNFIKGLLGKAFPPYKQLLTRQEQAQIICALINALPNEFSDLKDQVANTRHINLNNWTLFPEYKFVSGSFSSALISKYKKNGANFKISGLRIYSKQQNTFVEVEMLINNNLLTGLRIVNCRYELGELNTSKIIVQDVKKSTFEFPKSELEKFVDSLNERIKKMLNPNDISDIDFNNRTFFTFVDLEDGNYLAVDRNETVYSLVHDAKPMVKKMKTTFLQILTDIQDGKFDKQKHFDERYASRK